MTLTVAITGATAGIGAATARAFAGQRARLVLIARRQDRLEALAAEIGGASHLLACDIGDVEAYSRALANLPDDYAAIDVLVNNAGLALTRDPAQKASLGDWMTMIDTNIRGLVAGTHAVLPGMIGRGKGHIVNIGSTAGEFPNPGNAIYGPSKAFVHLFGLNLRADLLGTQVRVTTIEPGMVGGTEFSDVRYRGDRSAAEAFYAGVVPMTAEDVAETIVWAVGRPAHVNVNTIQLMPVDQGFAPPAFHRHKAG